MKKVVLNIDDDDNFNTLLKQLLKGLDVDFYSATTPAEFFQEFQDHRPSLCFLDINLGNKEGLGFKLLKFLREKFGNELPLIVLSKRGKKDDMAHALEIGASDYLTKPIDKELLISKINEILFHEKAQENMFPFFHIPEVMGLCEADIDINIEMIDEFGIVISSPHYIQKGVPFFIDCDFIRDSLTFQKPLKLSVTKSWIDRESNGKYECFSYAEFDQENQEFIIPLRRWLFSRERNEKNTTDR